jgi:hypothetical protein
MATSEKKIAANRINGRKSHGPKNTTSTRFNATKHGLLALGITELDDAEGYHATLNGLIKDKNPVGEIEMYLVKAAAVEMVKWLRAERLEAEFITGELNPPETAHDPFAPKFGPVVIDPGLPAAIGFESVQNLIKSQRYGTSISNRLFRILHELERLQRMREGESLPAPAVVDVSVHAETGMADSVNDETATVGLVHEGGGTENSALEALESPKTLPLGKD